MSSQTNVVKRPHDDLNDQDQSKKQKIDYPKGGLVHSLHGNIYQLKLLMLFLKRGLDKGYAFRLATEWDAAEKFDDLVFEYTDNTRQIRFLQAKHKQDESKTISVFDLLTEKDDEFSLKKYFLSYRKIKKNSEMFNGHQIELKDFVICTNIDLCDELRNSFENVAYTDEILAVQYNGRASKFLKFRESDSLKKDNLTLKFQQVSDLLRLAETLHSHVFGKDTDKTINLRDELFKKYHGALAQDVIDITTKKFKIDFINDSLHLHFEIKPLRKALLEKSKLSEDDFKRELLDRDLKLVDTFGKVIKLQGNPVITKNGAFCSTSATDLAEKIVDLLLQKNAADIISIDRRAHIIKENIDKLAGHVFIETEDDKIKFRQGFLNGDPLPGNLNDFRDALKAKSGPNAKIQFSQWDSFQFKINIDTCTEDDYNQYKNNPSYFESFYKLPNDEVQTEEIDEYLDRLVFAVNQPNEIELGEIIRNELGKEFNSIDTKNVYSRFMEKMLDWMKAKKGHFISHNDGNAFFEMLKLEILGAIWFNVKEPVRLFTGRKDELKMIHNAVQRSPNGAVVAHMTSVSGLGGIGKSELVRKYAYDCGHHYDGNVVWINGEKYETLVASFFDLARDFKLGIPTKDKDGKEKTVECIVKEVYVFFARRKSLFIFDNAENNGDLNKFLPLHSLTPESNKPYVLITSRNREWEKGMEVIDLNELKLEDAIEFVKKGLSISLEDKSQDQEIESLVKELQCFPLAIQQAIAYIEDENVTMDYAIDDYIKEYEKKAKDLLSSEVFRGFDNNYTKTTYTTWQITIDKIRSNKQSGQLALKILDVIAYFAPQNIPREIFLNLSDGNEGQLRSAVRLLVKYSMVNGEQKQSILHIHRLVQEVTRLELKEREEEHFREVLKLVAANLKKENLDHAASAWDYACESDGVVKEFNELPANIINELNKNARYQEGYLFGERASHLFGDKLGLDHPDTLRIKHSIAVILDSQGKYDESLHIFREVLNKRNAVLDADHSDTLMTKQGIALVFRHQAKYDEALEAYQEVLDIRNKVLDPTHHDTLTTKNNIAVVLQYQGKYDEALAMYNEVLDIRNIILGPDHLDTLTTKNNVAVMFQYRGKYDEALAMYKEVLDKKNIILGPDHPSTLVVRNNIAFVLKSQDKFDDALKEYKEVLDIKIEVLGPNHPDTLITKHNMAQVLDNLDKQDEALSIYKEVLDVRNRVLGENHFFTLTTKHNIAEIFASRGNYDEALSTYVEVLDQMNVISPDHPNTLMVKHNIAEVLEKQGNYADALKIFQEVYEKRKEKLGENQLNTLETLNSIASVLFKQNKYNEALNIFQEVLDKRNDILDADHPDTLTTRHDIAKVLEKQAKLNEALMIFQEVYEKRKEKLGENHPDTRETKDFIDRLSSH